MKPLKFLILSLFTVVVLITSIELFRAYCLSSESFDHFYVRDLKDNSDYERLQNICNMLQENKLQYVLEARSDIDDETLSVSYYCSTDEARKCMEKRLHIEGTYVGPFYGSVRVLYASKISSLIGEGNSTGKVIIYILNAPEEYASLPVAGDYLEREVSPGEEGSTIYLIAIAVMFALLFLLFLLLSLFEAYLSKKYISIRILNGESLRSTIGRSIVWEITGMTAAFLIPYLLLYRYCHNLPFLTKLWIPAGIVLFLDVSVFTAVTLRINIRETMGNAGNPSGILTLCRFLQVICAIVFLLLGTISAGMLRQYYDLRKNDSAMRKYEGFHYLSGLYEKPSGSELVKASGQSLICHNIASFRDGDGTQHAIFYANKNTRETVSEVTGLTDFPDDVTVCFIPRKIYREYAEQPENWGEAKQFIAYDREGKLTIVVDGIEYDNSVSLKDNFYISSFSDPIIVFFPNDEEMVTWWSDIRLIRKNYVGIFGGDRTDLYRLYLGCVSERKFGAILFAGIAAFSGILLLALSVLSLRLQYSVNALELCIQKTNGWGILARYQEMFFLQVTALGIGTAGAVLLAKQLRLSLVTPFMFGVGSLAVIILFMVLMIQSWERQNTVKVLKGGAI